MSHHESANNTTTVYSEPHQSSNDMSTLANLKVDTKNPALVTGATGYIAGVLIKALLEKGVTVHATVRDPTNTERLQYLQDVADKSPGTIQFFKGDLLEEGSFEEGMKGCSVVFHTASPFTMTVDNPQKDLVDPAVQGTRNVLNQATKSGTVKRVVVTSSVGAIYTDASDTFKAPNKILSEQVWNMTSSLDYNPYFFSKTMAEHAAWEEAGSQTQWTLVTINPSFVMGPGLKYHESSESFSLVKQMGNGKMASGVPRFSTGIVDVRNVAQAHVVAGYSTEAKGRFVLSGHDTDFYEMAQCLLQTYPNYPLPKRCIPKFLVELIGPLLPGRTFTRKYIQNNVDIDIHFDNTKSQEVLGIEYMDLSDTMNDMFQQMVDAGAFETNESES
jgi:dihydroflavonol-4-reductase